MAERALLRLEEKLDGKHLSRSKAKSVEAHVDILIQEATNMCHYAEFEPTICWLASLSMKSTDQYFYFVEFKFLYSLLKKYKFTNRSPNMYHHMIEYLLTKFYLQYFSKKELIHMPPVHSIVAPFTYELFSDARNAITSPTSLGSPKR